MLEQDLDGRVSLHGKVFVSAWPGLETKSCEEAEEEENSVCGSDCSAPTEHPQLLDCGGVSWCWILPNSGCEPVLQPSYILLVFLLSIKNHFELPGTLAQLPSSPEADLFRSCPKIKWKCADRREREQCTCSTSTPGPSEHQQNVTGSFTEDAELARQLHAAVAGELVPEYPLELGLVPCCKLPQAPTWGGVRGKLPCMLIFSNECVATATSLSLARGSQTSSCPLCFGS